MLNLALVLGEIWCMMNLERWALPVVGITAVVCVMNIREVLSMLDTLIGKFLKKTEKLILICLPPRGKVSVAPTTDG